MLMASYIHIIAISMILYALFLKISSFTFLIPSCHLHTTQYSKHNSHIDELTVCIVLLRLLFIIWLLYKSLWFRDYPLTDMKYVQIIIFLLNRGMYSQHKNVALWLMESVKKLMDKIDLKRTWTNWPILVYRTGLVL